MKRLLTLALALTSLALATSPARAQYVTGDLMIGFEAGGVKDVLLNLGPAQAFVNGNVAINIGNLNAALIAAFGTSPGTNPNIFVAVFGNVNPNDPNNTLYASRPHSNALSGSAQSSVGSLMSSVESEYNNEGASPSNRAIVQDSTQTPNSYLSKVTGGKVFNNYITETQFSLGTILVDRVPSTTNGGGAATTLGSLTFSFDGSGNVTGANFVAVPEPSTYALAAVGAGLVALLARRRAKAGAVA